ncbi:hypothetical protein B296_00039631 [Ensete ventricosum]|uniref:Protein kinase domain-containing protein n=1 Tax=Ensete ventricosum TaxID=4639 RepID=A0A426YRK3_ENSVE|nr:hypothetical protein B296_00039631 [Ensete ventricosum]
MRAKKGSTLVFWSVFFFLWTIVTATLSPKGVNFEAYLVDPHGVLENWDQDSVDPCSWTMVTCSPENLEELCLGNLRRFQFRELQIATNNFSSKNILGHGGFGNVYRGRLQDGTLVAIKRLKDGNAAGGEKQFKTEVEMISLAVHRNLLRLLGLSMTATERLLVYPDVKAANILLDDHCEAVVGDFGLAKLLDHRDSHVTTAVRGTVGHIAPEYLSTGQSSEKTDVYGFGILLLELITGLRAVEFGKASNQKGHRPKMSEVVSMLEGDGLAERWEASQRMEAHKLKVPETFSARYSDDISDDSSLLAQAVELSGPR